MKPLTSSHVVLAALAFAVTSACSSSSTTTTAPTQEKKAEAPPPEPITGRSAFYKMLPSARQWSTDVKGIQLTSIQLSGVKAEPGKAGAWRGIFVSESKGRMKTFLWSAVDAEGGYRQGTWPGAEESFRGRMGQAAPFFLQALQHDSDEAYQSAIKVEDPATKGAPKDTPINFLLEFTPRHPNLAWRVLWGETVGTARYSAYVDATTGQFLEKGR
ncbi:hypothetical protein F183_A47390 [Bryobacterales bacterium F-183]|nr:hypothetical protein F183_A47390 [Bryobacterales bacterium F-183]